MRTGRWMGLCALLCLLWPSTALAQGAKQTSKPRATASQKKTAKKAKRSQETATDSSSRELTRIEQNDDGYSYVFRDDPLAGTSGGPNSARIRVRGQGTRQMLLRPRLHFVPELLKSVENI